MHKMPFSVKINHDDFSTCTGNIQLRITNCANKHSDIFALKN